MKTTIDSNKILCKPFWKKLSTSEKYQIQKFSLATGLAGTNLKAVFDKLKIWNNRTFITIGFLEWFDEQENKIFPELWRMAWVGWVVKSYIQPYMGIDLSFILDTKKGMDCDVRITFNSNLGSYSLLGTDCLDKKTGIYGESTNLGWIDAPAGYKFTYESVEYQIPIDGKNLTGGGGLMGGTVLHEFGHILGMIHEHQNPFGVPFVWDRQALIEIFSGPPNYWDESTVLNNFFLEFSEKGIYNGSNFDPKSIMKYSFGDASKILDKNAYKSLDSFINAVNYLESVNTSLSIVDKYWLQKNYPGGTAPLIEKPSDVIDYDQKVDIWTKIEFFFRNMDWATKRKIIIAMISILILLFLYDFYKYIKNKKKK